MQRWRTRNLRLLYINDDQGDGKFADNVQECVRIESIDSLYAATGFLLRERHSNRQPFIDLVFSDANMELDDSPNDSILWVVDPDNDPARAFGPLLALPFLSAPPWCQFVPFSAYWTNPNVYQNGYTLVAIAMILTAIHGERKSTEDAQRQIDIWRSKVKETSLPALLPRAIEDVRNKIVELCKNGAIHLNGIDTTIHQLELWKIQVREVGLEKEGLPLKLGNEPICLEILHPGFNIHLIHISSLFADILDFKKPARADQIQRIIDTLKQWEPLEHAYPMQTRSAYQIACRLLYKLMPGNDSEEVEKSRHWTRMLKDKLAEEEQVPPGDAFDFIIRLAILFSLVRSWYLVKHIDAYSAAKIKEYVYHFLGADRPPKSGKSPTPSVPFRRLLGDNGGTVIGSRRYQRPFKDLAACQGEDGKADVLKAYMLDDEHEIGALEWREMLLCQYFVESGDVHCDDEPQSWRTRWNPAQYPRWMRITD